jgi:putative nucleotidyltransferase with HDIG domain
MDIQELHGHKAWFESYVRRFYSGNEDHDRNIRLKEEHTTRVCDNMNELTESLELPLPDRHLAEAIALFHDIGRFEQYRRYRTFLDRVSENHARLGLRVMAESRIHSRINPDEKRILFRSVAFHNAAVLPSRESPRSLLFMRLIRDADKLDIWRVVTDYYREKEHHPNTTIELGLPDTPECSPNVLRSIRNETFASISDVRTLNDFKLLQISWVFDLNFPRSFRLLSERNYLPSIGSVLPSDPEVQSAVHHACFYMQKRTGHGTFLPVCPAPENPAGLRDLHTQPDMENT